MLGELTRALPAELGFVEMGQKWVRRICKAGQRGGYYWMKGGAALGPGAEIVFSRILGVQITCAPMRARH
jgi:hypothetical protein